MNTENYNKAREITKTLTLREKVGQITQMVPGWKIYDKIDGEFVLTERFKEQVREYGGMGAIEGLTRSGYWVQKFYGTGVEIHERVKIANMVQKYIMENARVPMPAMLQVEAPHGVYALGGTVFPQNIAIGCSFDPDLYEEIMTAVGKEVALSGNHMAFITTIDVAKDPRWGRTEECYGEDPYLSASFAERAVKGIKKNGALACCKHFIACGASEGGIHCAEIGMGERELRDIHLPSAKASVDAGADVIMIAYSSIDGVPIHANKHLLKDIIRDELGYGELIMSDGAGIEMVRIKLEGSDKDAAVAAAKCGIELSLNDKGQFHHLEDAVKEGLIDESIIDDACTKVIMKKFDAGIMDKPYIDEDKVTEYVESGELQRLAYKAAAESIVLLKNDGVLPLKNTEKVVLIGQNATNEYCLLGSYTAERKAGEGSDILTSFEKKFNNLSYVEGWNFNPTKCDYKAALEAAKDADVILFCAGGNSCTTYDYVVVKEGESKDRVLDDFVDCGEGKDSITLEYPKVQTDLIRRLRELGKPIVTVLVQGRPYIMKDVIECSDAIVNAWYPGQEGADAIADVILGKVNPSGKLTLSIPTSVGCLPVNYNRLTPFHYNYIETKEKVSYEFGYGLSYSNFVYDNMRVTQTGTNEFSVSVDVTNDSDVAGKETVMLFIHGKGGSVARRQRELKAFKKVAFEPHEKKTVTLTLDKDSFKVWSSENRYEVERGTVDLFIGGRPGEYLEASVNTTPELI